MLHTKKLFIKERGPLPIFLYGITLIAFLLRYPSYTYYEGGEFFKPVTLFFGLFHGRAGREIILIMMGLAFFSFITSLFRFRLRKFFTCLAPLALIIGLSIHYENQTGFDHVLILPTQFFIVICLYSFFYDPNYRDYKNLEYPKWLRLVPALLLGIHYFGSGLTKYIESGVTWADGLSLMTWTSIWSDPNSFPANLILSSYTLSFGLQAIILGTELLCVSFFFDFKRLNAFLALTLIFFHVFNELLFDYNFGVNILFLMLIFIYPLFRKNQELHYF